MNVAHLLDVLLDASTDRRAMLDVSPRHPMRVGRPVPAREARLENSAG